MKKWIFCTKTTYLKILKAKDQLQWASQLNHDSPCSSSPRFNNSVNNWSMWGSSFKQIKLSQSLENSENRTKGISFARLSQIQLQEHTRTQSLFKCFWGWAKSGD